MPTSRECVCRAEIDEVAEKMQEGPHELICITEHEGFEAVCLMCGYFKLHTSSTGNTMVTMHRRNQYTSKFIDTFYCKYSDK